MGFPQLLLILLTASSFALGHPRFCDDREETDYHYGFLKMDWGIV